MRQEMEDKTLTAFDIQNHRLKLLERDIDIKPYNESARKEEIKRFIRTFISCNSR